MKDLGIGLVGVSAWLLSFTPAQAQTGDWEYSASIYVFAAETDTTTGSPFGPVSATLSFSDALENLDTTFMGSFKASNGAWSLLGDYMLTDISFSESAPGPALSAANASVKTQVFSGYAAYRVYETSAMTLDLAGGFRWFSTDTDITLIGGAGGGTIVSTDSSWTDPLIGAMVGSQFSDRWSGSALVDYGGFESGEDTWQVLLTVDYAINDKWLLRGGYRHIEVSNSVNGNPYSFTQSGPLFGATYRF